MPTCSAEPLNNSEEHNLTAANVTAKAARKMFVLKMLKPPNVERKLVEQNLSTKAVYELPFKVTIENKLRCFQYKMLHNILPTNSNLYKMKLRTSPSCDRCSHPHENFFILYMNPLVYNFFGREQLAGGTKRDQKMSP